MNKLIGIILVLIGGFLVYQGVERKDSVAGAMSEAGSDIANAVDGKGRIPEHYYYIIGGGVVAVAGLGVALRGSKK